MKSEEKKHEIEIEKKSEKENGKSLPSSISFRSKKIKNRARWLGARRQRESEQQVSRAMLEEEVIEFKSFSSSQASSKNIECRTVVASLLAIENRRKRKKREPPQHPTTTSSPNELAVRARALDTVWGKTSAISVKNA